MGEPMTKKIRVWNPAIDDSLSKDDSSPSISPTQPLDFSKSVFPQQMPLLMQSYAMHLAPLMMRMQQQQMETAMRQRFLSNLAQARQAAVHQPQQPAVGPMEPSPAVFVAPQAPQEPPQICNPLVASALGVTPISENCCAVCGASFRLTGDLVTHMRNNHRRTRFKRKNEKPVE